MSDTWTLHIDNGGARAFTATERSWTITSMNRLEDPEDIFGNRNVDITWAADDSGIGTPVVLRNIGTTFGRVVCDDPNTAANNDPVILLNPFALIDEGHWRFTSAHELGHFVGMTHAGDQDSRDPSGALLPIMGTCLPASTRSNYANQSVSQLDNDAAANISRLWDPLQYEQFTANHGFEDGKDFWKTWNGTMFNATTPSPANGSQYMKFRGEKFLWNSYMHQTVRVWDGDTDILTRVRTSHREQLATATTKLTLRAAMRPLEDGTTSTNCSYTSGIQHPDGNRLGSTGWTIVLDTGLGTQINNSTWSVMSSSFVNPYTLPAISDDGIEIQLRVHATSIRPDGKRISIHLDNSRVEGTIS